MPAALREVLAEHVAGARLERLGVAHHGFDGVGVDGTRERLGGTLAAPDDRDGQPVLGDRAVGLETGGDLVRSLLLRGVERVRLLPQELGGAQEQARAQLPADDVVPQVHEQRQVPVGLDPVLDRVRDDRLRRRPDGERLVQLLAARVGDPGHLGVEALDVLGFLLQQRLGHEQREVDVAVAGALDVPVQLVAHRFPDGVAVRPDDHAAAHRGVVRQLRLEDHVVVPAGEVLRLAGDAADETGLGHARSGSPVGRGRYRNAGSRTSGAVQMRIARDVDDSMSVAAGSSRQAARCRWPPARIDADGPPARTRCRWTVGSCHPCIRRDVRQARRVPIGIDPATHATQSLAGTTW